MCGIFAYLGTKNNAGSMILEGLKSLEYRGYDSWGIVIKKTDQKIYIEKHVGKIGNAKPITISSNSGIGHTRWATHGGVTVPNSHPHFDCKKQVFVVHNGIFENFEEYKIELLKRGHKFTSETDTEIIAHLIEEKLNKSTDFARIVFDVFKEIQGLNAVIVYYPQKNQFVAVKNGSPLVFGYKDKEAYLASDPTALSKYTDNAYFIEDGDLLYIDAKEFKLYDHSFKPKKPHFLKLNFDKQEAEKGKFPHFMIKEISEQPKVLQNILVNEKDNIENLAKKIRKAYGTYFIGCGTASYACIAGSYLFSKIAKRHANYSIGSEFSYLVDFLKDTSLVIALSQSGETIDVIESIKRAKDKKAKIFAITNVLGSTLYRMSDYKMLLNAGPEKAVASTKAFTAKVAILYLLSQTLNGGYNQGAKELEQAIKEVKKIIALKTIKKLAEKLKNQEHIYILGRGISYSAALESALKIKEVSYVHAEGFAGGELKHGVIALIEKGTPIIIYNPEDETYEDTLSSAYEVKARGAYVIGISNKNNKVFDEFIEVKNCQEATIIPNVVVAQLLGYYLALSKGLDPDKPRNLAKSVTVK